VNGRIDMGAVEVESNAGSLALSPASLAALEGSQTVTFSVTRSAGSDGPISVAFNTSSAPPPPAQITARPRASLNWANGELGAKTFTVTVIEDIQKEPDETVILTISAATGGAVISVPGRHADDPR